MADLYTYFRWLSLDIVTGAIFFLSYLGSFYQVELSFGIYFALASAIWLIYTTDHLIDAKKVHNPSSPRHAFHKRNFGRLVLVIGIVLIFGLINISYLSEPVIKNGAILSAACVGYLLLVYAFKKLWLKETLVALAYSGGIFLAPYTLKGNFDWLDVLLFVQVSLVAFINLAEFSYFELDNDQRDGFGSLIIRLGIHRSQWLIHALCILSILLSGGVYVLMGIGIELLILLMSAILYLLFLTPKSARYEHFRIIGDGVFYLPALFLL